MTLGGEGATMQWDVFVPQCLVWDESQADVVDEETRERILRRIAAGIQSMGFSVGFFALDK